VLTVRIGATNNGSGWAVLNDTGDHQGVPGKFCPRGRGGHWGSCGENIEYGWCEGTSPQGFGDCICTADKVT